MKKLAVLLFCASALVAAKGNDELKDFIGKFAGLLKTADHATMVDAEMVHFPLRLKGTLDDSPEIKITEKQFPKVLPKIANQPSGMNPKNFKQTEKDYVSSQVVRGALPTDAGEGTVRLGNLVFGKKSKKWKLVMVYTSDELIAEFSKKKK
ncbi:MAG: hypothetical protein J0L53_12705 [Spirochaetes bacterium]|nr:hypothetical protein [Spirochaetota bacterium]